MNEKTPVALIRLDAAYSSIRKRSMWPEGLIYLAPLITALLALFSVETALSQPPELPLMINAGSYEVRAASDGTVYLPDQEWEDGNAYGFIDGHAYIPWRRTPVSGTEDPTLFQRQRWNWTEYRVADLAPGDYIIRLSFAERAAQGPGQSVFSVQIEDEIVLPDLDLFDVAGLDRAHERSFLVHVDDGELNVLASKKIGKTQLATLTLWAADSNAKTPDAPTNPAAIPTYDGVIVSWQINTQSSTDGYHVYRTSELSRPPVRITDEPVYDSRFIDLFSGLSDSQEPSSAKWHYSISTVDLFGRESRLSKVVEARPHDPRTADLPVYELDISAENLAILQADIRTSDEVPASIRYDGRTYPAMVRFRGGSARRYPKKSWKVIFPNESPIAPRDRMNLRAQYEDPNLLRGRLTSQLYESTGIRPPDSRYVMFFVNGEYAGLFDEVEQVDETYLKRTKRDPDSSIYGTEWTWHGNWGDALENVEQYHEVYSKETNRASGYGDLIAFTEDMTYTDDSRFAAKIAHRFDVKNFLNYYAVIVLTQNMDFTRHNIYLLHDLVSDQWEIIPWDPDYTWGISAPFPDRLVHHLPIDMGTEQSPQVFNGPNNMLTRILEVPQYRTYYCSRLQQFLDLTFSESRQSRIIDANYQSIEEAGLGDWHKVRWEDNARFESGPEALKTWVADRNNFLQQELGTYCHPQRSFLVINEVMSANTDTLCDPDEPTRGDCYDPWLEIYNAGLSPQPLQGLYLTDDPTDPTRFQIRSPIVVPALGHMLFWADGETEQGPTHTNFRPAKTGGVISIIDRDGSTVIDSMTYEAQDPGHPIGRHPDGSIHVERLAVASPSSRNRNGPSIVLQDPIGYSPRAKLPVSIQATIVDDGSVADVTLFYRTPEQRPDAIPMKRTEFGVYDAMIPAQPPLTLIEYYIVATDDDGLTSRAPSEVITDFYTVLVGYQRPPLQISQFKVGQESWIELQNVGNEPINLGGMVLANNHDKPAQFVISDNVVVSAGDTVLFPTDGRTDAGANHTGFTLPADGADVELLDGEETYYQMIDHIRYNDMPPDSGRRRCYGNNMWLPIEDPIPENQEICTMNFLPMLRSSNGKTN